MLDCNDMWFVCLQRANIERFSAVFDMIDWNDPRFVCLQRAYSERFPAVFDMIDCNDPVVMNTLIDQVKIRTDNPCQMLNKKVKYMNIFLIEA